MDYAELNIQKLKYFWARFNFLSKTLIYYFFVFQVRRLRSRIEELKREVATAQDELDAATNNVRYVMIR